jgi:transposase-like protein
MKRRKWTSEEKAIIVLSGMKGQGIGEICNVHGISQAQYYKWKDQFLSNAQKAFEMNKLSREQVRLVQENKRLKGLVGELTLELKKSEEWL